MRNAEFKSLDEIKDIESHNINETAKKIPLIGKKIRSLIFDVSRDNARTPMIWDSSEYGGFSKAEPWIRVNPSKNEVNVEKSLNDKNSLFYFYKKLIEFKLNHKVIENGQFEMIDINNPHIFAYVRENDNEKVVVVSNFSNKEKKFKYLENLSEKDVVISNFDNRSSVLKPFETRVYLIKKN